MARTAAADLRRTGKTTLAKAVETLVQASEPHAVPTLAEYLTTIQAGELLGVSGQTIKNWVSEGKLSGYRLGGRIVIPRQAVETYVQRARRSLELEDLPDGQAATVVAEGRGR